MLWRGIEIEPQWVVLALLVIAIALGRGKQFIFDFFPFLLLFFEYYVMRGYVIKTRFVRQRLSVLQRVLYVGHVRPLVLQGDILHPNVVRLLDVVRMIVASNLGVRPGAIGVEVRLR